MDPAAQEAPALSQHRRRGSDAASSAASSADGAPRCRLCWGDEGEGGGKLISPCACRGSMRFIHVSCLQRWLETTRQQGRPRWAIRCEVCKSRYRGHAGGGGEADEEELQLLPRLWQDPFTLASVVHGGWRAYVAVSGLLRALSIYRSIGLPPGACARPGAPGGWRGGAAGAPAAPPPPLPRLTVTLPLGGAAASRQLGAGSEEVLEAIRDRFDKATMVQVFWYTALIALTPQPPNGDAFTGMAIGATTGGLLAHLIFLPLLGSGALAALRHSCGLLLRCLLRLLAAEACQARAYRLLVVAARALLQRRRGLAARLRLGLPWPLGGRGRRRNRQPEAGGPRRQQHEQQQQQQQGQHDF